MSQVELERCEVNVETIVVSASHNYVGHYGRAPGTAVGEHRQEVELVPGQGIAGDRFASGVPGNKKQITFFELETLDALEAHIGRPLDPAQVRRNVFLRGVELNRLVGKRFRLVPYSAPLEVAEFHGVERCNPCFWMDTAVAPGAETFLTDRGGLRARILTGARLRVGKATLELCP